MAANMDTVGTFEMAKSFARVGSLGENNQHKSIHVNCPFKQYGDSSVPNIKFINVFNIKFWGFFVLFQK